MSADTFDVLTQKGAARSQGLTEERRRLQGVFNARAKSDREAYLNKLADEAEVGLHQNNLRSAYRTIQRLAGMKTNSAPAPVNKLDGNPCSSTSEILGGKSTSIQP